MQYTYFKLVQIRIVNLYHIKFYCRKERYMAKKSKIVKAAKQRELIKKYYELKEAGNVEALAKLPLDAHPTHYHNRDLHDGRPHGYA